MHVGRVFSRMLCPLLGFVAAFFVASNAEAQLSAGHVAEPADSRTLTRLLKRYVSPTVPQWMEIETIHDGYLERFEVLRDGDVARFSEFVRNSMTGGVPDARTAREYLRRRSNVAGRIADEDERLLNEIAQVLEEDQLMGLDRVRKARARTRYGPGLSAPSASPVKDLWSVLGTYEREIGRERMELLDAELISYEERLTSALKAWNESQESMFLVLIEELQRRGLGDLEAGNIDPTRMSQTIEALNEAIRRGQEECREAATRVRELNDRAIKSIETLLGEDLGRRVFMAYVEADSGNMIIRDPQRIERTISRILEREEIVDSTRDAIRGLRVDHRTADDRLVTRMRKQLREIEELIASMGGNSNELGDGIGMQLAETRESFASGVRKRNEVAERTVEQLRLLVEDTGSAELLAFFDSGDFDAQDSSLDAAQEDLLASRDPERGGPTGFIPRRISKRSLEDLIDLLELESWQQAVLRTIYEDYVDSWRREVSPIAQESTRAQSTIYSVEPETLRRVAHPDRLLHAYAKAVTATEKAGETDRAFFDALGASLDDDQQGSLARTRHGRELDRLLRGTDPIFDPSDVAFSPGNVVVTIDQLDLTPEEDARVDAYLRANIPDLLASARAARDVRFESERRLHELNMRMSQGLADGTATSTDHGIAYRRLSDEMVGTHGASVTEWKRVHQEFVDGLTKVLEDESERKFKRAWKQASNPFVYRDPNAAVLPIEQALQLGDITNEQLTAIGELLADYESEWYQLSSEMADVRTTMGGFGALTPQEDYAVWDELTDRYSVLSFRRDEASLRALRRLARYLDPEQQDRIRALRRLEE